MTNSMTICKMPQDAVNPAVLRTGCLAYPAWLVVDKIDEELWQFWTPYSWRTDGRHLSKALGTSLAYTPDAVFTQEIELGQLYTSTANIQQQIQNLLQVLLPWCFLCTVESCAAMNFPTALVKLLIISSCCS